MYIYKIENTINNKFYIWKCSKSIKESKNYYGSWIIIRKVIKKYWKRNLIKKIIEKVDNIEDLNLAEKKWINFYWFPNNELMYNLCWWWLWTIWYKLSNKTKNKISKSVSKSLIWNKRALWSKHTKETKNKMSEIHKWNKN